jgi:hypothetical protein
VEVGRLADGVDEADVVEEAEPCDVWPKIFGTVEIVVMEDRIVEFTAGEPPSEASARDELIRACSDLKLYWSAEIWWVIRSR